MGPSDHVDMGIYHLDGLEQADIDSLDGQRRRRLSIVLNKILRRLKKKGSK